MVIVRRKGWMTRVAGSLIVAASASIAGAAPTISDALQLVPVQQDVLYDEVAEKDIPNCTFKSEKLDGRPGWVVRDPNGQVIRRFLDTDGDNVVDQWSYYSGGMEVYRDIDSDHNGKADQYRWIQSGGMKWGLDKNEDKSIDEWKTISIEEVSEEIVEALVHQDVKRFERLLLKPQELEQLGLGDVQIKNVETKLKGAEQSFSKLLGDKKQIGKMSWVDFGGSRPGMLPAGVDGATKDVVVYDNAMAIVEIDGKHSQVILGTVVKVGEVWRLIDAPRLMLGDKGDANDLAATQGSGIFATVPFSGRDGNAVPNQSSDPEVQPLLEELEQLDKRGEQGQESEKDITARIEVLDKIIAKLKNDEDKGQWRRQLADTLSAVAPSGLYPDSVKKLGELQEEVAQGSDKDLIAYVQFRLMTAQYTTKLQDEKADFEEIQKEWISGLEKFVDEFPESADAAEGMLQLAIAQEVVGEEKQAISWYGKVISGFPDSTTSQKAAGAKRRLESVGKSIELKGKSPDGKKQYDINQFKGRVVLVHYWSTTCEPCKTNMPILKELQSKFGKDLAIIGVSLDSDLQDLQKYLKSSQLPWPQLFEPGGLESRFANEMGILTLPTMILLDQKGHVANRNIHITELEKEIGTLLK